MYKFIRPLLFRMQAEKAHDLAIKLGRTLSMDPIPDVINNIFGFHDKCLEVKVAGLTFANPIGLAAGLDKNAEITNFLASFGFGHIEAGTTTPRAQTGNPRPHLWRLPADHAIINRMGFPNQGVERIARNLSMATNKIIKGGNIGKNSDTPNDGAAKDYITCLDTIYDHVDYIAINISSPNTPELRKLQDKQPLTRLLSEVVKQRDTKKQRKPLFLKISPDLETTELDDILQIIHEQKLDGIITANTTISRDNLTTDAKHIETIGHGGLSGKPIRDKATKLIAHISTQTRGELPIIGSGGIFTAEDAYEKIKAGASLLQIYTSLIYEGPEIVGDINRELVKLLEKDGYNSIQNAVGGKIR